MENMRTEEGTHLVLGDKHVAVEMVPRVSTLIARGALLQDRRLSSELQRTARLARRGRPRPQFYLAMLLALLSMALLIHRSLRS